MPKHLCRRLAAALLTLVACQPSQIDDDFRAEWTDSGIPLARNSGASGWSDGEGLVARLTLDLGSLDGDGPEVFGDIRAIGMAGDGDLFVLDALAQEVRIFDGEGEHLRSFGRRGDGPGEFRYADALILDGQDSVWVYDPPNQRLSVFDSDGTFHRAIADDPGGLPLPTPTTFSTTGQLLGWSYSNLGRDYSRPMHAGDVDLYQVLRVDPASGLIDSLPSISSLVPKVGDVRVPGSGTVELAIEPNSSLWFSHPTEYTLYHRSPNGDTLLVVTLENQTPVPVTRAERDSIAAGLRSAAKRLGYEGPLPGALDIPSQRPLVDGIFVSELGYLFVLPRLDGVPEGSILDAFDSKSGRYLGRIELPFVLERRAPARLRDNVLLASARGELDVPRVVRVEIVEP